mmetsp:Transcript_9305/g.25869  ORF Transcript_9305/g.25869 Transcript_9305/m.25869 type:complete len:122 (+) Transcript_9305:1126-1491(+)
MYAWLSQLLSSNSFPFLPRAGYASPCARQTLTLVLRIFGRDSDAEEPAAVLVGEHLLPETQAKLCSAGNQQAFVQKRLIELALIVPQRNLLAIFVNHRSLKYHLWMFTHFTSKTVLKLDGD